MPKDAPAEVGELGRPLQKKFVPRGLWAALVCFGVSGAILALVIARIVLVALGVSRAPQPVNAMLLGLAFFVAGGVSLAFPPVRIWFCPAGMIWKRWWGKWFWCRWEDLRFCRVDRHFVKYKGALVFSQPKDGVYAGTTCTVGFPGGGNLTMRLQGKTVFPAVLAKHLLARARAQLERNQPVKLIPFTITRDGLTVDGQTHPWSALARIDVVDNTIRLRGSTGKLLGQVPLDRVTFPMVVLPLLDSFLPPADKAPPSQARPAAPSSGPPKPPPAPPAGDPFRFD